MNIQQFYRILANTSLNTSLTALFFLSAVMFLLLVIVPKKEIVLIAIPFFLYSLFYYQLYRIHYRRSTEVDENMVSHNCSTNFFKQEQFLVEFMPAPSLRMLFFEPNGLLNGEIRDLHYKTYRWFLPNFIDKLFPAAYGLYDARNHLLATFIWRRERIAVVKDTKGRELLAVCQSRFNPKQWCMNDYDQKVHVQSELIYMDIRFVNEEKSTIGRMRKGWMPLDWEKLFKNPNTPVLSFDREMGKEEKLLLLTILIHLFRYREH